MIPTGAKYKSVWTRYGDRMCNREALRKRGGKNKGPEQERTNKTYRESRAQTFGARGWNKKELEGKMIAL